MPEQIHVREQNGEILIFLDKHMIDRLAALEEASKIIQREVLREKILRPRIIPPPVPDSPKLEGR